MPAQAICYLDYNASTPVHPRVAQVYTRGMKQWLANPASAHFAGQKASLAIQQARERVASALGCSASEVWFTSGGTESNNWILKGMAHQAKAPRNHLLISAIEHKSVLRTAQFLQARGEVTLTELPVSRQGIVELEELKKALGPRSFMVSVMLANNETGMIQPLAEISEYCHRQGIFVHTDAVCALGKMPVHFAALGVDALSLSAHKLYAPKGVGALILRQGTPLEPLIHGCGQQSGMRSGTEHAAGAAALGKACQLLQEGAFGSAADRLRLTAELRDALQGLPLGIVFHGAGERLSNTLSVAFPGFSAVALQSALSQRRICVSAGAAASTAAPSQVLTAMGVPDDLARATLRLSLGWGSTSAEVMALVQALAEIIKRGEARA